MAGCLGDDDDEEIDLVFSSGGFKEITLTELQERGILEEEFDDRGYDVSVSSSSENTSLYASEEADIVDVSPLEAAQLGTERDIQTTVVSVLTPPYPGLMVRADSEYDPDVSGSLEESMQLLADDGLFAIGSWAGGDVPKYRVIMPEMFDLSFEEDDGDFEVTTADYFALPELLADGEVDVISTSGHYGVAPYMTGDEPELTTLFWNMDMVQEMGYGTGIHNAWTAQTDFVDENPEAMEAVTDAWQEGVNILYDEADDLFFQDEYMELIGCQTEEEAEFVYDWAIELNHPESPDNFIVYDDVELTDEFVSNEREYLDRAAEIGTVTADWDEYVQFEPL
ncbi:hypothetical protein EA462_13480 [Natrarchaeobius halalkaliphilus]|uniref:ABC transporter substrate-binding protein n=1 Tax=Natrarchaeobius halalkaliphilus TaxID=1679091 RepID=A0A3N6M586_9EURY|nr:hypothetical protein [Natrarchaeobius halalkaliphilus]RQG87869.1 hypothetical protein EA462_13480 [Natrarchaeobius halalkaliphilus]